MHSNFENNAEDMLKNQYALLINAIELLEERFGVHINIHNICAFSSKDFKKSERYSFHDNCFCNYVKRSEKCFESCVAEKNQLIERCSALKKPFFRRCYMGIGEFILPVFAKECLIAVICIGIFCDSTKEVISAGENYSLDKERLQAALKGITNSESLDIFKMTTDASLIANLIKSIYENHSKIYDCLKSDEIVFSTLEFIDSSYMRKLTLKLLAANCHCNPSYLSRQFKKRCGMNITDYINLKRVEKAKELLSISSASVTDIALDCGFNSADYFSQIFKKHTGKSPIEYRKNN